MRTFLEKRFYFKLNFLLFLLLLLFPQTVLSLQQKGMALGLFSKDLNYSYLNDLKEMKKLGVTHVLLVVSWYQKDVKSNEIAPRTYDGNDVLTLPDSKLKQVITQAHSLGLKTVLFPILRIETRKDKDWRGVIRPSDFEGWWNSYYRFILHYAKIAAIKKVEFFSVGSELLSREKEIDHWEKLIEEVRKIYPRKIFYSANWDHYRDIPFWNLLDFIGMTAYYELSKTKEPTLEILEQKWKQIRQGLLDWKKQYPKQKIIFTEIGYPSIDGTNIYPWNYYLEGKVDLEEQALCYEAFIKTWDKTKELAGVYFWVWWEEGGPNDNGYTPRGKPATQLIQKWYR